MPSSCESHPARGEIRNDLSTNIATLTSTTSLAAEAFRLPRNLRFIVGPNAKIHSETTSHQDIHVSWLDSEREIMSTLHHPHIVGCFPELRANIEHPHYVILEFCEYGDLNGYKRILTASQVESMSAQLFSALQYSHNLGIVHRDLKPGNVVVASVEPFIVKVTDFGLAGWGPWTAYVGTPLYVAPEMARNQDGFHFTAKVDVWSLGMMQLEFSTIDQLPASCPAFNPKLIRPPEQSSFEWDQFFGQLRTARPKPGFEHLTVIANRMLIVDPDLRPSAEACARFLDQHRKEMILPWVMVDKRRCSAITVCLSALLEYGLVKREIRQQLLRRLAKLKGSIEISYTDIKEREPGLYVPFEEALSATQEYVPDLGGVLKQAVNEQSS